MKDLLYFKNPKRVDYDSITGAEIRQVTAWNETSHHPFYYIPSWDNSMNLLFFVSHVTGNPQIFVEQQDDFTVRQITQAKHLAEWSIHPSGNGEYVYYIDGDSLSRASTETGRVDVLGHFGTHVVKKKGFTAEALGTTALSRDDKWWAVPIKGTDGYEMLIINTETGSIDSILKQELIFHPQFHPSDSSWLRYAGPYNKRIWTVRRDGSENKLMYQRDVTIKEWIVHETWSSDGCEILSTRWPYGVIGIDVATGNVRRLCNFNAWHPMTNITGTMMVTDTTCPDRGIYIFDPRVASHISDKMVWLLCMSESSNVGSHWDTDHCPYDDKLFTPYAPQHTHPHPGFSPDSKQVIFTSDKTGVSQVYTVRVDSIQQRMPLQ